MRFVVPPVLASVDFLRLTMRLSRDSAAQAPFGAAHGVCGRRGLRVILVALFALALLARPAAAQSTTVTVNANQGPWVQTLNPSFNYGDGTNAAPTAVSASSGIPFNPGGTVTV